jgi:hypothetical protein
VLGINAKKNSTALSAKSFAVILVRISNGVKLKRINQMTDKKTDKEIDRLLYTIITVVSVIVFTVYKVWSCL